MACLRGFYRDLIYPCQHPKYFPYSFRSQACSFTILVIQTCIFSPSLFVCFSVSLIVYSIIPGSFSHEGVRLINSSLPSVWIYLISPWASELLYRYIASHLNWFSRIESTIIGHFDDTFGMFGIRIDRY